ncbi:hypothetical protein AZE42_11208 [Rhizopogon vesiculosus]|uniref:Uncharacterized protein n=1 Tax=Rhizopogon vesiculosus TaxID=180088 RepID=A0A1J8QV81_9AGAM|nr:hypothetical protein AZE42_11208 [Rhizopogon vesiculosus]
MFSASFLSLTKHPFQHDGLLILAGRLALDKERFHQQSQNNGESTEVDLDDFDVSPTRPSDSNRSLYCRQF